VSAGRRVPLEKCVGRNLKNLGPSQKTLRHPWCPKLVTGLLITQKEVTTEMLNSQTIWKTVDYSCAPMASRRTSGNLCFQVFYMLSVRCYVQQLTKLHMKDCFLTRVERRRCCDAVMDVDKASSRWFGAPKLGTLGTQYIQYIKYMAFTT